MNRKTAGDYRRELSGLESKSKLLDIEVRERLLSLAEKHPDAIIKRFSDDDGEFTIKAKNTINKAYVSDKTALECIEFIGEIESWLIQKHPHKQLKINF